MSRQAPLHTPPCPVGQDPDSLPSKSPEQVNNLKQKGRCEQAKDQLSVVDILQGRSRRNLGQAFRHTGQERRVRYSEEEAIDECCATHRTGRGSRAWGRTGCRTRFALQCRHETRLLTQHLRRSAHEHARSTNQLGEGGGRWRWGNSRHKPAVNALRMPPCRAW